MKPVIVRETHSLPEVRREKRKHAADIADDNDTAQAKLFHVSFRKGQFESYRKDNIPSLLEAYETAKRFNTDHGQGGRRACIYAMIERNGKPLAIPISQQEPPGGWENI